MLEPEPVPTKRRYAATCFNDIQGYLENPEERFHRGIELLNRMLDRRDNARRDFLGVLQARVNQLTGDHNDSRK